MHSDLVKIQQTIDRRVSAILADRGDWLCRAGCDHCCRHLASIPEISEAEWQLLRSELKMLPTDVREQIKARVEALNGTPAPIACPFLDQERGICLVYESRPLACRTYGFYVERDRGLYCQAIESRVDAGEYSDVVWGNQAGIDSAGSVLGPARSLVDWFA